MFVSYSRAMALKTIGHCYCNRAHCQAEFASCQFETRASCKNFPKTSLQATQSLHRDESQFLRFIHQLGTVHCAQNGRNSTILGARGAKLLTSQIHVRPSFIFILVFVCPKNNRTPAVSFTESFLSISAIEFQYLMDLSLIRLWLEIQPIEFITCNSCSIHFACLLWRDETGSNASCHEKLGKLDLQI